MTPEEIAFIVTNLPVILTLIREIAKETPENIKATIEALATIEEAIK